MEDSYGRKFSRSPNQLQSQHGGKIIMGNELSQLDYEGRYKCPLCEKSYLHVKHLKRHYLKHTGDRPYECALCHDSFSRSDILKRHFQKCSSRQGTPSKMACAPCVQSNMKCDQRGPCGNCRNRRIECTYMNTYRMQSPPHRTRTPSSSEAPEAGEATTQQRQRSSTGSHPPSLLPEIRDGKSWDVNAIVPASFSVPAYSPYFSTHSQPSILFPESGMDSRILPDAYPSHATEGTDADLICQSTQEELTSTGPSGRTRLGQSLETRCRELISHCFHSPDDDLARWLHPNQVDAAIAGFKKWVVTHYPIVHLPTFDPCTCHPGLLLAVITFGGIYSDKGIPLDESRKLLDIGYNFVEHEVMESKYSRNGTLDVEVIQAMYFFTCGLAWHGSAKQRAVAGVINAKLGDVARRCGLLRQQKPSHSHPWRWHDWIQQETLRRTMYVIYLLDAAFVIWLNVPPNFGLFELHLQLPFDDEAWDAPTPEAAHMHIRDRMPADFGHALRALLSPNLDFPQLSTNAFGKCILIHALHTYLWTTQNYLETQPESEREKFKQAMYIALEKWRTAYKKDLAARPTEGRRGICRGGELYYWLAKLFLAKNRLTEWQHWHGKLDTVSKVRSQFTHIRDFLRAEGCFEELESALGQIDETYGLSEDTCDMRLLIVKC